MNLTVVGLFPKDINKKIDNLRKEICKKFKVHCALLWPPHITMRSGFSKIPENKADELANQFQGFLSNIHPVKIILNGFYYFDTAPPSSTIRSAYAVTLDVSNSEEIIKVNQELRKFKQYSSEQKFFHPHVTLAYNDLDQDTFQEIKRYLHNKDFQSECYINEIALIENKGFGRKKRIFRILTLGQT
jgi:2'-5' RNA ligase